MSVDYDPVLMVGVYCESVGEATHYFNLTVYPTVPDDWDEGLQEWFYENDISLEYVERTAYTDSWGVLGCQLNLNGLVDGKVSIPEKIGELKSLFGRDDIELHHFVRIW